MSSFAERLARVQERIASARRRSGCSANDVRLMGVSKLHPTETLVEAFHAGLTLIGENRVQEFDSKRESLAGLRPSPEVHLIGHLQSNKSARAAEIFAAVESVDSLRLAERLSDAAAKLGKTLPILLEIKLSPEPTKAGLDPQSTDLPSLLDRIPDLRHLALRGLMTIAPLDESLDAARVCFRQLRVLREALARQHPRLDFPELSMGMSGDFEIAIEEGSTLVRIGTALFGERRRAG